jgi:hypothetical protein
MSVGTRHGAPCSVVLGVRSCAHARGYPVIPPSEQEVYQVRQDALQSASRFPLHPWKMQPAHGYLEPEAGGLIGIRVMVPRVDDQGRRGLSLRAGLSE